MAVDITIITPVYNEKENLRKFIPQVEKVLSETGKNFEIVIVDDNSPDGSGAVSDSLATEYDNIKVIHRNRKMGLGTAYKEGYKISEGRLIISIDSDLSHDPCYLPEMMKAAEKADLVIGSRLIKGGNIVGRSFCRDCLSIVTNIVIRLLTRKEVFDWTSGLRVYRRALWEDVMPNVHCDKWDFQFESLYNTVKQGYRVREVPITFYERANGESKFSIREGLVFLGSFLRIVFKLK